MNVAILETQAECIGAHRRETCSETGACSLNKRNDEDQRKNPQRNDHHSDDGAQPVAHNITPGKGKRVSECHGDVFWLKVGKKLIIDNCIMDNWLMVKLKPV